MKKYKVSQSFSLLERVLIIETDEIYAEQIREMHHVYSPKTRKRLGTISSKVFANFVELAN